jgi:hypothetical protein
VTVWPWINVGKHGFPPGIDITLIEDMCIAPRHARSAWNLHLAEAL